MATPIPAPPEHHQASFTHFPPHSPSEHSPLGDQHPQDASRADGQDFEAGFQIPPDFHISARGMTTNGHEPVQMPRGPTSNLPPRRQSHRSTMSMSAFDISRSPPNPKSTSHVPCKFFRTGQCQAGPACPFSHDFASTGDEICRYFQKGNCKFGQKCALAHVLPNGRRVNRPNGPARGSLEFGSRIDPQLYPHQDPAAAQSLLAQQANGGLAPFSQQLPPFGEHDRSFQIPSHRPFDSIPTIDTDYASPQYGSPLDPSRPPFPQVSHLDVLDAPLPASFDSQGISYIARHGPVAASLPTNLGPEYSSPPPTSLRAAAPLESTNALRTSLAAQRNPRSRISDLGSSPVTSGDEGQPFRTMHSQRVAKPNMLSASLPRVGTQTGDWEDGLYFSEGEETDFIPSSLHDQILTPQEKMRRSSRNEQDNRSVRESLSGLGTPGDSSSKVGSPHTGSPASRFGAFFGRRQPDVSNNIAGSPSQFGPVGSPLRNLHPSASPSLRAKKDASETSPPFPAFGSPQQQSTMSILSQQLGRTRISVKSGDGADRSSNLHPNAARHASAPNAGFGRSASSSTNRDRIEEEQGGGVFSLEEEEEVRLKPNNGASMNTVWSTTGPAKSSIWN